MKRTLPLFLLILSALNPTHALASEAPMNKTKFSSAATMLIVEDVRESAEFYRDKLGFVIESIFEGDANNPTRYAIVSRDGISIHFESYERFKQDYHDFENVAVKCGVYFLVYDVDALHDEFKSRGVDIAWPPTTQGYGIRDMKVLDPDGYQLNFGTPTNDR